MKSFKNLFIILLLIIWSNQLIGQVTIGSEDPPKPYSLLEVSTKHIIGGVRMPQLNQQDRDNLSSILDNNANGLVIYNTTIECIEYWNSNRWISLCTGSADISFQGGNPNEPIFLPDGEIRGPFVPKENPACTGQEPYTFIIVTGADFMNVEVLNPLTGEFNINMPENTSARQRTAILRITNNCTQEYKELLFAQEGNTALCVPIPANKPVIAANGDLTLCQGGACHLYIKNPTSGVDYIWTMNEVVVGRGISYAATVQGTYKVYANAMGCETVNDKNVSASVTVTKTSNTAPSFGTIELLATNNGVLCGGGNVTIWALNVPNGAKLAWFYNGEELPLYLGRTWINVGEGEWMVAVKEGSCYSLASKIITTIETPGTLMPAPQITVNGTDYMKAVFCSGGALDLSLANASSFGAITVKWYNGTTFLGEGKNLTVTAPTSGDFILRCNISDNSGSLCPTEISTSKTLTGVAPGRPNILASSEYICGGNPVTLTSSSTQNIYTWFMNGVKAPSLTGQSISVSNTGSYQLQVTDMNGCKSPLSSPLSVGLSDFPQLIWQAKLDEVEPSSTKTYQVSGSFYPSSYVWTLDNGATIVNGAGTNTVSIKFPALNNGETQRTSNISVRGTNACGNGVTLTLPVTIKQKCDPVIIGNSSISSVGTVMKGTNISMSIAIASGTGPFTYQWKVGATNIVGATNPTYIISNSTKANTGTYSCVVTQTCSKVSSTEIVGSVTVIDPIDVPTGSGTLLGTTCFDVALTTSNSNGCGTVVSRQSSKADFVQATTNTQIYSFKPSGVVSNVRFFYVNTNGEVIKSLTPNGNYSGTGITTTCTATAVLNSQLNDLAKGLRSDQALTGEIYVIYTNGLVDNIQKIVLQVKDCQCCGANVDKGVWKSFMCHNLGANPDLDPYTPITGLLGNLYQWGVKNPAALESQIPNLITGWSIAIPTTSWGNGSKSDTDPCPYGFRVPSKEELDGLLANNTASFPGTWGQNFTSFNTSGLMLGSKLLLPSGGFRNNNSAYGERGYSGHYWSGKPNVNSAFRLGFWQNKSKIVSGEFGKNLGFSVRCVAE